MDTKINYDTTLIDSKTGECIEVTEGTRIISANRQNEIRSHTQKNALVIKDKNTMFESTHQLRGQFYSIPCNGAELLWEKSDISEPTMSKLIYLATFMDNNNCICFDGNWDEIISNDGQKSIIRNGVPMTKQDIQNVLSVNRRTFSFFWKECIDKQLIIEKNNQYYLPKDKFRFCNSSGINKSKTSMVKVFKHAVRYMYEHTDEQSKRTLIHLYKLIPFINLTYNGLCLNPFETNKEKIKPLSLGEICKMFGIDTKYQLRFLKKLKKFRFIDKEGKECSVIRYTWLYYDKDIYWVTINPQFYSGYISEEAMIDMIKEFRIDNNFSLDNEQML